MRNRRSRKPAAAAEETREPAWRRPLTKRRKKVHGKPEPLGARLAGPLRRLGSALWARRPRWSTFRSLAATIAAGPARIRLPWKRLLLVPLAGIIIFAAVQLVVNERFYVYGAEITGNQRITDEQIYQTGHIDKLHILWVHPSEVTRALKALPWVADASVQIALPNQVAITVQEREPLMIWQTITQTAWIASDGTPLTETGEKPSLTLIDDDGLARSGAGFRAKLLHDIQVLHALRPELTTLRYGAQEGLYYKSPEGWLVYLGNDGQMTNKMVLLQTAKPKVTARITPTKIVDLRVEGDVYLR